MVNSIYILDEYYKTKKVLTVNSKNTFFDDLYTVDLSTGVESFEFSTNVDDLEESNYVMFYYKNQYKLFQIVELEQEHSEGRIITSCYGESACLELLNNTVRPFGSGSNFNCVSFFQHVLYGTGWSLGKYSITFADKVVPIDVDKSTQVWTCIQDHMAAFECELNMRVIYEDGRVKQKLIDIYAEGELGDKTYKRFEYGRNVDGIVKKKDLYEWCTALVIETEAADMKGVRYNKNGYIKEENSDVVYATVENDKYNLGRNFIYASYEDKSPSGAEAVEKAVAELKRRATPHFDYECDTILTYEEYEDMSIGDTVYVIDHSFNPPITLEARVGKLELSFTNKNDCKCNLTNYKEVKPGTGTSLSTDIKNIVNTYFPIVDEQISDYANIKGTKILLDEQNQNLQSAFSQITTTVSTCETKTSQLEQDLDGFKFTVSDTIDKRVVNNLIYNSSVWTSLTGFEALGGEIQRYDSLEKNIAIEDDFLVPDTDIPSKPTTPDPELPPDGNEDGEPPNDVIIKPPTVTPKPVKTRIHFILTAECGDCILIETDSGKNILIDAPDSRLISPTYSDSTTHIINYLDKVGITKLDYVICTHFHSDHAGALPAIMDKYCNSTSEFIYNNISDSAINAIAKEVEWKTTQYKANAINKANSLGMKMTAIQAIITTGYNFDENTEMAIYKSSATTGFTDYNETSLAVVFKYKGIKVALTGDINTNAQSELMYAIDKCDIVKDPHHGYNSWIVAEFIRTTNPKDVIVTRTHDWGTGYSRACNSVGMWQSYEKNIYPLWYVNDHIIIDFVGNSYIINTSKNHYFENCWLKFENNNELWCYFKQGGKYARNETLVLDGKKYHFNNSGYCTNPYNPE